MSPYILFVCMTLTNLAAHTMRNGDLLTTANINLEVDPTVPIKNLDHYSFSQHLYLNDRFLEI